jgi:hypothetical protein
MMRRCLPRCLPNCRESRHLYLGILPQQLLWNHLQMCNSSAARGPEVRGVRRVG